MEPADHSGPAEPVEPADPAEPVEPAPRSPWSLRRPRNPWSLRGPRGPRSPWSPRGRPPRTDLTPHSSILLGRSQLTPHSPFLPGHWRGAGPAPHPTSPLGRGHRKAEATHQPPLLVGRGRSGVKLTPHSPFRTVSEAGFTGDASGSTATVPTWLEPRGPPHQAAPSPARRPLLRAGGEPQASRSTAIRETRPHVRMYGWACATARARGLPVRGPWAYVSSGKMLIGPVEPGVSLPISAQAGPRYSGSRWHLACSPYGSAGRLQAGRDGNGGRLPRGAARPTLHRQRDPTRLAGAAIAHAERACSASRALDGWPRAHGHARAADPWVHCIP